MRRPALRSLRLLLGDERAATIVEFGFVLPVMVLLIMGLGEILYQEYAQSILNGALQKAGRDSTIQGAGDNTAAIDAKVMAMVNTVVRNATLTAATRRSYDNFANVAPEPFTDTNNNGIRDTGECYSDQNANGTWDADPGETGQGGAGDVTLYTITVTYPRLFPMAGLAGWSSNATLTATTLLKNQPYASQTTTTAVTKCT